VSAKYLAGSELLDAYPSVLDVPFKYVLDWWDVFSDKGRDETRLRALCMYDRYFLLVQMCGRVDMLHPWVYARCREVEQNPDGFLDLWSREHFKSSIITFGGSIQEILCDPNVTIGIFSHTAPHAKKFLLQIKTELEENRKLKYLFPDILYDNPERQARNWSLDGGVTVRRIGNPRESTVEAHGLVDGMPIGAHFKLRIYDDVVVPSSVGTPDQIAKTTEAWENSDNLGTEGGRAWHVGTRYHFNDTYNDIIRKGVLRERIYPATDDGTPSGRPVYWTPEEWERRKKTQGPAVTACQLLLNPVAGKQGMFDVEDLQTYEVRPNTLNVYVMCDPARSTKRESDKTCILVVGVDYALNKYLLDGFNHRMKLGERWTALSQMYKRWKVAPGVQRIKIGYEKTGAQADMDYFEEQMQLDEGNSFVIEELDWPKQGEGSKIDRVQRLGPDIADHKWFLPHPTNVHAYTALQRKMQNDGYEYRISRPIRRRDEEGEVYDLSAQFREVIRYFPFVTFKDIADCASRIYDMEVSPPVHGEPTYAEPEFC
jgi:hypothetical protein